jgi:nitrate reductase alpha subunit
MRAAIPNWSPKEIAAAADMWQRLADDTYGEDVPPSVKRRVLEGIGIRIKRDYSAVYNRFVQHGPSFKAGGVAARIISPHAIAQRDARRYAIEQGSLTAQIFGDPPAGYSALDKRKPSCGAGISMPSGTGRR